jgi:hypothetical protein
MSLAAGSPGRVDTAATAGLKMLGPFAARAAWGDTIVPLQAVQDIGCDFRSECRMTAYAVTWTFRLSAGWHQELKSS